MPPGNTRCENRGGHTEHEPLQLGAARDHGPVVKRVVVRIGDHATNIGIDVSRGQNSGAASPRQKAHALFGPLIQAISLL